MEWEGYYLGGNKIDWWVEKRKFIFLFKSIEEIMLLC